MDQNLASWLREVGRLSLQYFVVGLSFAPWGLVYAWLTLLGFDNLFLLTLLLGGGCVTALIAWQRFDSSAVREVRTIVLLQDDFKNTTAAGDAVYIFSRTGLIIPNSFRVDQTARNSMSGLILQRVV